MQREQGRIHPPVARWNLEFRLGEGNSEPILFVMFRKKQIPRCARDDTKRDFFSVQRRPEVSETIARGDKA